VHIHQAAGNRTCVKQRGSFDRYRREALQITDADVVRLKARLLE